MPSIKDFDKKTSNGSGHQEPKSTKAKNKRRPGRDPEGVEASHDEETGEMVGATEAEVTEPVAVSAFEAFPETEATLDAHAESTGREGQKPKVEIQFPGSEILRSRFSKPFEVAESVASSWVHGGNFEDVPIEHPLVKNFVATGLQKAKSLESKVMESPVTEKVTMKVFTAGMKAQQKISELKTQVETIRARVAKKK